MVIYHQQINTSWCTIQAIFYGNRQIVQLWLSRRFLRWNVLVIFGCCSCPFAISAACRNNVSLWKKMIALSFFFQLILWNAQAADFFFSCGCLKLSGWQKHCQCTLLLTVIGLKINNTGSKYGYLFILEIYTSAAITHPCLTLLTG